MMKAMAAAAGREAGEARGAHGRDVASHQGRGGFGSTMSRPRIAPSSSRSAPVRIQATSWLNGPSDCKAAAASASAASAGTKPRPAVAAGGDGHIGGQDVSSAPSSREEG